MSAPSGFWKGIRRKEVLLTGIMLAFSLAGALLLLKYHDQVHTLGRFGYVGAFVLALVGNALVAVPFPWIFPVAAMGATYSPAGIIASAAVGAAIGEVVPYLMGRSFSDAARSSRLTRWIASLSGVRKTIVLVGLAFSPVLSYPGLAAGVFRYPVWAMVLLTIVAEGFKIWLFIAAASTAHRLFLA